MSNGSRMHDQPDNRGDEQRHQEGFHNSLFLHVVRDKTRNDVTNDPHVLVDVGKKEKTFLNYESKHHAQKHGQHESPSSKKYDFPLEELDQATGGYGQQDCGKDPEWLFKIECEISCADQASRQDPKEFRTQETQQYTDSHG